MTDYQINENIEHINPKAITFVISGILFIAIAYLYIPKIIDSFVNPNNAENKTNDTNQNTTKLKSLEDYLKQTSNPAPKLDLANESFGRDDPFASY